MDVGPAILIFTPIFLPIVMNVGVDPVHFGLFAIMNLCVGSITPPVGTGLYVGASVGGVKAGANAETTSSILSGNLSNFTFNHICT